MDNSTCMQTFYNKCLINLNTAKKLIGKNVWDPEYTVYLDELLMQTYTSYDEFMINTFNILCSLTPYKIKPLLTNTAFKEGKSKLTWVPPTKPEDVAEFFPLLKNWVIYGDLEKLIQTLVDGRNIYAHTGKNIVSFEQILNSIGAIHLLVQMIFLLYVYDDDKNIDTKESLIESNNYIIKNININEDSLIKFKNNHNISTSLPTNLVNHLKDLHYHLELLKHSKKPFLTVIASDRIQYPSSYTLKDMLAYYTSFKSLYYSLAFGNNTISSPIKAFGSQVTAAKQLENLAIVFSGSTISRFQ